MKKINCKLIVSDFDGTLLGDDQKVSDGNKAAINEYVACGGIFAVCTGRALCSILPRVRELGLKGLVIANQGCVIADIESGEIIKNSELAYNDVAEICREISALGHQVNIYSGDIFYTDIPKDNVYLQTYEKIVGVETIYCENLPRFVTENKINCQKVVSLVHEVDRDWLYNKLNDKLSNRFEVTCSAKVLVEIAPFGENKGAAVKFLCEHFNVPIEKSVACGDNLNDLSMIVAAGTGVAVANADNRLKEAADFITVSNNQSAIAQIIKKFGFA